MRIVTGVVCDDVSSLETLVPGNKTLPYITKSDTNQSTGAERNDPYNCALRATGVSDDLDCL